MPRMRHAERRAHVAEGDIGDLPLAVPQHRRRRPRRRAGRAGAIVGPRQAAPVVRGDRLVDGEHAVDRRLEGAGEFGRSPCRRNGRRGGTARGEPASRVARTTSPSSTTPWLPGMRVGGHRRRGQALVPGAGRDFGRRDDDVDRVALLAAMGIADRHAAEQRAAPCRRRRSARRRRIPAGPGRWRCAGAGAAGRSCRRRRRCTAPSGRAVLTSSATARRVAASGP